MLTKIYCICQHCGTMTSLDILEDKHGFSLDVPDAIFECCPGAANAEAPALTSAAIMLLTELFPSLSGKKEAP